MHEEAFLHWHCHSDGSQFDGLILPEEFEEDLLKYDKPGIAVTDHGTLRQHIDIANICKKHGKKFMPGGEFYVVNDKENKDKEDKRRHVVLLAMNQKGFENLVYLQTLSSMYFYHKPRISHDDIFKKNEGLICLTACMGGIVAAPFLWDEGEEEQRKESAKSVADRYHEVFGDRFYLEIQPYDDPNQTKINCFLIDLHLNNRFQIIATNDAHYAKAEQAKYHNYIMKVQSFDSGVEKSYKQGLFLRNKTEVLRAFFENGTYGYNEEVVLNAIETANDLHNKFAGVEFSKTLKIPEYKKYGDI